MAPISAGGRAWGQRVHAGRAKPEQGLGTGAAGGHCAIISLPASRETCRDVPTLLLTQHSACLFGHHAGGEDLSLNTGRRGALTVSSLSSIRPFPLLPRGSWTTAPSQCRLAQPQPLARLRSLPGAPLVPSITRRMQPASWCRPGVKHQVLSIIGVNNNIVSNYTLSPAALSTGGGGKLDPFYSSKQQFGHPELSRSNRHTQWGGCSLGRG